MKNKNGYTLIEIIGAIIIIGIISIIAIAVFTRNLRGFRDDYYTNTERTMAESGKEFFGEKRHLRPTELLEGQKVSLKILTKENFLESVKDYNGEDCTGYVLSVKEGKNDYSYHACLSCPLDKYDTKEKDIYCDESIGWELKSTIDFNLAGSDDVYIYRGTSKDKLKELLYIGLEYIRKNANGDIITRAVDEEGETIRVLPQDIDLVNTEVIGDYPVTYEYNGKTKTRVVHVYENDSPEISIKYKSKVATNLIGGEETKTGNYVEGSWAQEITLIFTQAL